VPAPLLTLYAALPSPARPVFVPTLSFQPQRYPFMYRPSSNYSVPKGLHFVLAAFVPPCPAAQRSLDVGFITLRRPRPICDQVLDCRSQPTSSVTAPEHPEIFQSACMCGAITTNLPTFSILLSDSHTGARPRALDDIGVNDICL
jgi:hypothetical protein